MPNNGPFQQLRFWQTLSLLLSAALTIALGFLFFSWIKENSLELNIDAIDLRAPHAQEIRRILRPLRYSGIQHLLQPDVYISIDLKEQAWTLHNIHRYDDRGNILLPQGLYGVCGDLSAYVYRKILPLFKNNYSIEIIRVGEAAFFNQEYDMHLVLGIYKKPLGENPKIYILDPSFHRYGELGDFHDYRYFEKIDNFQLLSGRRSDEKFPISSVAPLVIKKNHMLGIIIKKQNNRFDENNYALTLIATQRYSYGSIKLLSLEKTNGNDEIIENKEDIEKFLSGEKYDLLKQRLVSLFKDIRLDKR